MTAQGNPSQSLIILKKGYTNTDFHGYLCELRNGACVK